MVTFIKHSSTKQDPPRHLETAGEGNPTAGQLDSIDLEPQRESLKKYKNETQHVVEAARFLCQRNLFRLIFCLFLLN